MQKDDKEELDFQNYDFVQFTAYCSEQLTLGSIELVNSIILYALDGYLLEKND